MKETRMSLTPRQAFKFGFLLRCADENLSEEETQGRIKLAMDRLTWDGQPVPIDAAIIEREIAEWEKQAAGGIIGGLGQGLGAVGGLLKDLGWVGLLGGAGAGALGGYSAARMTKKDVDPKEMKKQELIAAYKQQAERIRRQMAARSYRQPKAPRAPRLVV
jgi:hypothetical protein